jgi:hypothetical protein
VCDGQSTWEESERLSLYFLDRHPGAAYLANMTLPFSLLDHLFDHLSAVPYVLVYITNASK